jgi:hypothetical protein
MTSDLTRALVSTSLPMTRDLEPDRLMNVRLVDIIGAAIEGAIHCLVDPYEETLHSTRKYFSFRDSIVAWWLDSFH